MQAPAQSTPEVQLTVHLRDAIVQRAQSRGDSAGDLARILDMSVGHWYRIRKEPVRLGGLSLNRVQALADYVGWPKVQVMIAVGWLRPAEVGDVLSSRTTIQATLQRLATSALAMEVTTPLERAAPDHQRLMARLMLAAESAAAAGR